MLRSKLMATVGESARDTVSYGADTYSRQLAVAGGKELEALPRRLNDGTVRAALYTSPPYDLHVPALPVARLSVNMTRSLVTGGLDGERPTCFGSKRHSLFLTPAGAAVHWRKESPSCHLNIYFHAEGLDQDDDIAMWLARGEPMFNFTVPGIRDLADDLATELHGRGILGLEAVDSLARLILVRLARRPPAGGAAHPLTPQMLEKLRRYVLDNLSERILVSDLARQAGMGTNRFAQLYSEQTGQSPHRFVLALRLEHATALLRRSKLGLVDVAQTCGFASQQHLSNTMRRHLGATPARYRATQRDEDQV